MNARVVRRLRFFLWFLCVVSVVAFDIRYHCYCFGSCLLCCLYSGGSIVVIVADVV